jgi:hypothetical protein
MSVRRCLTFTAGTTASDVTRRTCTPRLDLHSRHRRMLATPLEVKPGALPILTLMAHERWQGHEPWVRRAT